LHLFLHFIRKKSEADAAKALKKQHEMDVRNVTLHTLSDQIQCHHCAAMYWMEGKRRQAKSHRAAKVVA
jgi:hypothetical protein